MKLYSYLFSLAFCVLHFSCSKNGTIAPPDPCAGITITVNGTATNTSGPGLNDGIIQASAAGASGFTFSLDGGTFQSSGTFNNLPAGTYSITAKSSEGCTGTGNFTIVVGDPCAGKTINITTIKFGTDKCDPTGKITITATGSTNFMYKLNSGGTYQASNELTNVPAGSHTIYVRDGAGCEKTQAVTIDVLANGPLFTNVRSLITAKCGACHMFGSNNGGATFDADCNVVALKLRIKARAVDTNEMPQGAPLSAAEKKIISDWLTAGGLTSN
jgi:hypothetical protein